MQNAAKAQMFDANPNLAEQLRFQFQALAGTSVWKKHAVEKWSTIWIYAPNQVSPIFRRVLWTFRYDSMAAVGGP